MRRRWGRWVVIGDGMPPAYFWTRRSAESLADLWRYVLPHHHVRVARRA